MSEYGRGEISICPKGYNTGRCYGPADNNGICSIRMGKELERVPGLVLANIFCWEYKAGMPLLTLPAVNEIYLYYMHW
jgi:hypothetical protein